MSVAANSVAGVAEGEVLEETVRASVSVPADNGARCRREGAVHASTPVAADSEFGLDFPLDPESR
jgi:hypothetical protein